MPSTELDLKAIQARVDAASKEPWHVKGLLIEGPAGTIADLYFLPGSEGEYAEADADAEFIAHARADVPALLAKVAELQGRVDELTGSQVAGRAKQIGVMDGDKPTALWGVLRGWVQSVLDRHRVPKADEIAEEIAATCRAGLVPMISDRVVQLAVAYVREHPEALRTALDGDPADDGSQTDG